MCRYDNAGLVSAQFPLGKMADWGSRTLISKRGDGRFPDYLRNSPYWFGRKPWREKKQYTANWVGAFCLIPVPEAGILGKSRSPGL